MPDISSWVICLRIKKLRTWTIVFPLFKGKWAGTLTFTFQLNPKTFEDRICSSSFRSKREYDANLSENHQEETVAGSQSFINEGGYFPNSIIISIDTNGKGLAFDRASSRVDNTLSKLAFFIFRSVIGLLISLMDSIGYMVIPILFMQQPIQSRLLPSWIWSAASRSNCLWI